MNPIYKKTVRSIVLASLFAVALLGGLAALGNAGKTAAAPLQQAAGQGCWTAYRSVGTGEPFEMLDAVAGSSANNVVAVGMKGSGQGTAAFATRWDGVSWASMNMPDFGTPYSRLNAVTVLSPTDAWAVGTVGESAGRTRQTLIVHWDGQRWGRVNSLNATGNINELRAVAAVSANDVWAAGYFEPYASYSGGKQALILHWNGHEWELIDTPDIPPTQQTSGYSSIEGLAVISKDNVWAVGGGTGGLKPLTLHWDGTTWTTVPTGKPAGVLYGVSALAPNDVWAVGYKQLADGRSDDTLTLHWDGQAWTEYPSLGNGTQRDGTFWLMSVAAFTHNDVWAVGFFMFPLANQQMVLEHWDGQSWSQVANPSGAPNPNGNLSGAANVAGELWTVGQDDSGGTYHGMGVGLVLRHQNTGCPSPTATPLPLRTPLPTPVALPGTGSRLFSETGKTVSGIFLKYWNEHGGLMQQGYPISEPLGEVSDLNGRLYTVQYFERAVFEYHPEYQPPYDVLLSQLGTFRYYRKYAPLGAPNQQPNTSVGSVLFPETGRRLGGAFLDYWRNNGGLMQQGYPISDEFTEFSDLNGLPYKVQYFERAVFEYHPENTPPYQVLLSQLGTFRYREVYGGQPTPHPSPTAQANMLPGAEAVAEQYIFWREGHGQVSSIDGYDLSTARPFSVTVSATNKQDIASDGHIVVWDQDCPPYCHRIRAYDLQTQREYSISEPVPGRTYGKLWVDAGKIYYQKYVDRASGLYEYNPATGLEREIWRGGFGPTEMFQPVVENGLLLWSQANRNQSQWALHMMPLDSRGDDIVLATGPVGFTGYHSSGDNIVWSQWGVTVSDPQTDVRVFVYNFGTRAARAISTGAARLPVIRGNTVAWFAPDPGANAREGTIQAYDLATNRRWDVARGSLFGTRLVGIAAGDHLVYTRDATATDPGGALVVKLPTGR